MSDPHHPKDGEKGTGANAGMIWSHGKWVKAPGSHGADHAKENQHGKEHH